MRLLRVAVARPLDVHETTMDPIEGMVSHPATRLASPGVCPSRPALLGRAPEPPPARSLRGILFP